MTANLKIWFATFAYVTFSVIAPTSATSDDNQYPVYYLGIDDGRLEDDHDKDYETTEDVTKADASSFNAGIQFNELFGIEYNVMDFKTDNCSSELKHFSAILDIPGEVIIPFARIGLSSVSKPCIYDDDNRLIGGMGARWKLSEVFNLRTEFLVLGETSVGLMIGTQVRF